MTSVRRRNSGIPLHLYCHPIETKAFCAFHSFWGLFRFLVLRENLKVYDNESTKVILIAI